MDTKRREWMVRESDGRSDRRKAIVLSVMVALALGWLVVMVVWERLRPREDRFEATREVWQKSADIRAARR